MSYIVAAIVGGAAMFVELQFARRYWFTVEAAGWWIARIVLDAALGFVLALILRGVPESTFHGDPIVTGILAGLAAPRVVARLSLPIYAHNANLINIAYMRAVVPIDANIDDHSASAQQEYCDGEIGPATIAGTLTLTEVSNAFSRHIVGLRGLTTAEQNEKLEFIRSVVDDKDATDADKVMMLVLKAWQLGAYVSMKKQLARLPRRPLGFERTWHRAKATLSGHLHPRRRDRI